MSRPVKVLLSAGEASGDRLGAGLAEALRRRRPDIEILGMGGAAMAAAGVRLVQDASEVAVVGFVEVASHLRALWAAMDRLRGVIERERPDVVVPIDFPDFNLRLASRARRAGVPVVYFVSPQVWAWRRGRVRRMRGIVRRMLVLFPFEERFYREAGIPVTFVGHPSVDTANDAEDSAALLSRAGLDPGATTVALLPGSRKTEIDHILPVLLRAVRTIGANRPGVQYVMPRASTVDESVLRSHLDAVEGPPVSILEEGYPAVLRACRAGVVASGTATVDAAIAGMPFVVVYRVQPLSYLVARMLVRVEHVALANLVAGRRVVPELIQGDCTPGSVARELSRLLDSPDDRARVVEGLRDVRRSLGEPGGFDRAASAVLDEIHGGTESVEA